MKLNMVFANNIQMMHDSECDNIIQIMQLLSATFKYDPS